MIPFLRNFFNYFRGGVCWYGTIWWLICGGVLYHKLYFQLLPLVLYVLKSSLHLIFLWNRILILNLALPIQEYSKSFCFFQNRFIKQFWKKDQSYFTLEGERHLSLRRVAITTCSEATVVTDCLDLCFSTQDMLII